MFKLISQKPLPRQDALVVKVFKDFIRGKRRSCKSVLLCRQYKLRRFFGLRPQNDALFPYSPIHLFTSKKAAFTLAEVLITLGIIGVVAAITMPTIIKKYQQKVTVERLKSTYSIIMQAMESAKEEYGYDTTTWIGNENSDQASKIMYSLYFKPFLQTDNLKIGPICQVYKCSTGYKNLKGLNMYDHSWARSFYLKNGSFIHILPYACGMHTYSTAIYIDINGPEHGPNILGKDTFDFVLEIGSWAKYQLGGKNRPFVAPYDWYPREELLKMCSKEADGKGCSAIALKSACATLIMKDGWKIAPDYPW